ncbi:MULTISPECIES: hypothetical protein [Ferrimonas]|uniref:hypothetical protein n=1 Tax=Ferrimonas TaxID=44011 RepID=UPI0012EB5346|nr:MULTISPECIES: hypothetical protein [Ferrimonas]USD38984.1 hypothetical protein J8Z22_07735 [Ferrimonas sp. SCSIO 43195]
MTRLPIRAVALLLLLWTVSLSMLASQGLEESLHHHEAGVPCAHALLIDHWFQAAATPSCHWPALPMVATVTANESWPTLHLFQCNSGNRDPPATPS